MSYAVNVVADSVGPNRHRLTTFEMTYPLIIHSELMTHRMLSRCVASNRAIPVARMIEAVMRHPFIPEHWPKNQRGMQATEFVTNDYEKAAIVARWLKARNAAVEHATALSDEYEVHKQITNRLLAPFLWTTAVVTATHWANFFNLRCHPAAQPEMRTLADMMQRAYLESTPRELAEGDWHAPYAGDEVPGDCMRGPDGCDKPEHLWVPMVSAGRCAGVSYLRHGEEKNGADAYNLAVRLTEDGHWSPLEHPAQAMSKDWHQWSGNFFGWFQFRKMFHRENRLIFRPNHPALLGTGRDRVVVNPS